MKRIVIIGTLDTKREQIRYLKERIEARGHRAIIMDLSMGGVPPFEAEITPAEIASLVGKKIEDLRRSKDRFTITEAMTAGAQQKALELLSRGELDGITALGGTTMALTGSRVMRKLPFGIPKVIAVDAAMPVHVGTWFDAIDMAVMQVIMELSKANELVKHAIEQIAGTISGMVEESRPYTSLHIPYPSIAITEFGLSPQCGREVDKLLNERGYHVFSFHAGGVSDRAMERLISQGLFDGVIDVVPAGLIDELYQGNKAAGMERLDAAGERGLPQVLAPGCINLTGCGPSRRNRERYALRPKQVKLDETRWMTRYNAEELGTAAKLYAEKLNKAKGPVKFLVPLRGWTSIDKEGSILYDPEGDSVFTEELKKYLKPEVEVQEIDCNIEDPEFAKALVDNFDKIFKETAKSKEAISKR